MRRTLQTAALALAALLLAACAAGPSADAPPGAAAQAPAQAATDADSRPAAAAIPGTPVLDRSCRVDSDCEVKNVGNCCGYYPACVNRAAEPDPAAVQQACRERGLAGVCGFPVIEACACVAGTCQAAAGGATAR